MRMQLFDMSQGEDQSKPYLPMLSSDEKERIMEQYYSAKQHMRSLKWTTNIFHPIKCTSLYF